MCVQKCLKEQLRHFGFNGAGKQEISQFKTPFKFLQNFYELSS
jgi:hypothetical protein